MDSIKKQFKDFWAYFRLCRWGYDQRHFKRGFIPLIFAVVFGTMVPFMQMSISDGSSRITFNLLLFMFVGASFGMGLATSHRPTLLSVAPFTPKQRVVFSYLTILLQTLIFAVIYFVIMIAFLAFLALVYFVFWGENIFVISNDPEYAGALYYSANGESMQILFMMLNAFSIYAATNLKRNKSRCWAVAGFYAGYEIFTLAVVNGVSRALGGTHFRLAGDVWYWVDSLADGWFATVILAVLVAIAFALSVVLSVRRHKSENF